MGENNTCIALKACGVKIASTTNVSLKRRVFTVFPKEAVVLSHSHVATTTKLHLPISWGVQTLES